MKSRTPRFGLLAKIIVFLAAVLVPLAAVTWLISVQTLRQTFLVAVPELETGMLLAVGLLGLALFGGSPQRAMASGRSQRG